MKQSFDGGIMLNHKFRHGNRVRICPSWFDKIENSKYAQRNEFYQNGKDRVYIIDCYYFNAVVCLVGYPNASWSEHNLILDDAFYKTRF